MTEAIASNSTSNQVLIVPQLIVGLGNPEPKYDQTRHNIGFAAVDAIARAWQIPLADNRKFQGIFGEGRSNAGKIRLLKPLTYMNNSGQAIRAVTDWYKLPPESVLAIYDDMDLPLGKIRLRLSGSAGGHNGMKSAIAHLGTQNFPRLRIGIGRPQGNNTKEDASTISYVLGRFSSDQTPLVAEVLQMALEAVELSLKQGVAQAMNRYNNRNILLNAKDTKQAVGN
ncbi:MAG: Peptidyl-tRNA hydrolase [Chroococcidiopsis cubana SAG 39.79]|jgi:peptidyl-tRNA hydrolase, PTH1 family|uniref:Peptidyl-tRNA hydrolase n=2 Tax=Chroococcidiopsis TaxID=54298 RepID=A0AB37US25_9CYAN|nr:MULTISPECIES: aminoacyl-tRNA hydrolase [Chroococcidiopsis]MDZ4878406.1 Peptidyl-tRNA hydrolase [Chroococcidiopsis cubana SAG 39.79]RUT14236.1 peptidyl-tRNA hydrolase [Chroococcidiopsis cubana SAG 39.79]URD50012.1 aminoacyl-tRNA hydrolase [Chroococcidiopsis sp. CCNUC1]